MERHEFEAGPWCITVTRNHILRSTCEREANGRCSQEDKCPVCRFASELSLPSLPEMVFPRNSLRVEHGSGCGVMFTALEGLKMVDATQDPLKVAAAEVWSQSRSSGLKEVKDTVKQFDWTFTTRYQGTVFGGQQSSLEVCDTEDRIDYDRLRQQEKIYFYDEVILYEDELADNGVTVLSAKIRVMASGFFILLRLFLRVDGVLVRLIDTRIYHQAGTEYLLREFSIKEAKTSELRVSGAVLTDPNKLNDILPVKEFTANKLILQSKSL